MPDLEGHSKGDGRRKIRWCGTVWPLLNLRTQQLNLLSSTNFLPEETMLGVEARLSSTETLVEKARKDPDKESEEAENVVSKNTRQKC